MMHSQTEDQIALPAGAGTEDLTTLSAGLRISQEAIAAAVHIFMARRACVVKQSR